MFFNMIITQFTKTLLVFCGSLLLQTPHPLYDAFLKGEINAFHVTENKQMSFEEYLQEYCVQPEDNKTMQMIQWDIFGDNQKELIVAVTCESASWIQDVFVFHLEGDTVYGQQPQSHSTDRWDIYLLENGLFKETFVHNGEESVLYQQYDEQGIYRPKIEFSIEDLEQDPFLVSIWKPNNTNGSEKIFLSDYEDFLALLEPYESEPIFQISNKKFIPEKKISYDELFPFLFIIFWKTHFSFNFSV